MDLEYSPENHRTEPIGVTVRVKNKNYRRQRSLDLVRFIGGAAAVGGRTSMFLRLNCYIVDRALPQGRGLR